MINHSYKIALLEYSPTKPVEHLALDGRSIIYERTAPQCSTPFYSIVYQCGDRCKNFTTLKEAQNYLQRTK